MPPFAPAAAAAFLKQTQAKSEAEAPKSRQRSKPRSSAQAMLTAGAGMQAGAEMPGVRPFQTIFAHAAIVRVYSRPPTLSNRPIRPPCLPQAYAARRAPPRAVFWR